MAMQLTRAGEYAIKSLVYLASRKEGYRALAQELATAENIPVNFVRKILETMVKAGLVKSYRGMSGGFALGRPATSITLREVLEAVEGPLALNQCLTPASCDAQPGCPMSQVWMEAQHALETVLGRYSLADVARTRQLRRQAGLALQD